MSFVVNRDVQSCDSGVDASHDSNVDSLARGQEAERSRGAYEFSKRLFDVIVALAGIPVFVGLCAVISILNARWNQGSLFIVQERIGKGGFSFKMLKFRTMVHSARGSRGPQERLDANRITSLGRMMRRSRIDEVPQLLNVLRGDMSLIGPRPDLIEHAAEFREKIPIYRERTKVLPGITGYAQTRQGYTDTIGGARLKAELDAFYVRNRGWSLDFGVLKRTFFVILTGYGAR